MIGTSNVKRIYDPDSFTQFKPYLMRKCCNKEVFIVELSLINASNNWIIITVHENILCDTINSSILTNTSRVEGSTDVINNELVMDDVKSVIDEVADLIKATCLARPGLLVAVVEPLMRPANLWYTERFVIR